MQDKALPNALMELRQNNTGRLLHQAARAFSEAATEQLNQRGHQAVSSAHSSLIAQVDIAGTRSVELAQRLNISKQAVGQLVDELVQLGYLQRQPDPLDKRASLVCFTPKGQGFLRDAYQVKLEIEAGYQALLGAKGLEQLRQMLGRLLESKTP